MLHPTNNNFLVINFFSIFFLFLYHLMSSFFFFLVMHFMFFLLFWFYSWYFAVILPVSWIILFFFYPHVVLLWLLYAPGQYDHSFSLIICGSNSTHWNVPPISICAHSLLSGSFFLPSLTTVVCLCFFFKFILFYFTACMFSLHVVTVWFCIHCKKRKKDKGQSKLLLKLYSRNVIICFFLPYHSVVGLSQAG